MPASSSTTPVPVATPVIKQAIDQNAEVVIFGYHRFVPNVRRPDTEITPQAFETQMQELKNKGISVIPMQDFLAWRRGEKAIPAKSAILTFDDGWKSQHEVARLQPVAMDVHHAAVRHQHDLFAHMRCGQCVDGGGYAFQHLGRRLAAGWCEMRITLAPAFGGFRPFAFNVRVGLAFKRAKGPLAQAGVGMHLLCLAVVPGNGVCRVPGARQIAGVDAGDGLVHQDLRHALGRPGSQNAVMCPPAFTTSANLARSGFHSSGRFALFSLATLRISS